MLKKKFHEMIKQLSVNHIVGKKSIAGLIAPAVEGLIKYGSVLHKHLAAGTNKKNLTSSGLRAIERFFADTEIFYQDFFCMIASVFSGKQKFTVVIDRTNWFLGTSSINLFVAAVIWKNFAIPIVWISMNKRGTSSPSDRIKLITILCRVLGKERIDCILADREFLGKEWLTFLNDQAMDFVIRIRNNMFVELANGRKVQPIALVKREVTVVVEVRHHGINLRLCVKRSIDGNIIAVIASKGISGDILSAYRMRWLIELFFKSIKTKGFNIESTRMVDPERIGKLMGLIALSSLLLVSAGSIRSVFKKIPVKKHGRKLFSIFTYGLDFLRSIFNGNDIREGCRKELIECLNSIETFFDLMRFLEVKNVGY